MTGNTYLQLFLGLNAFILGVVATLAYRHWHKHIRPGAETKTPEIADETQLALPEGFKEELLRASARDLGATLRSTRANFEQDLDKTSEHLNGLLEKFGSDIVNDEMNLFQARLKEIRESTADKIGATQTQTAEHQQELEAAIQARRVELETAMQNEIVAEKQHIITELDTKLSNAVTSFLLESLESEVDLGAQTPHLIAELEAHKDELMKEVGHGESAPTS